MHLTVQGATPSIAAAIGAWLIVRGGTSKGMLAVRVPVRSAACGRRRVRRDCSCTGVS
jgi:hypothetical protein